MKKNVCLRKVALKIWVCPRSVVLLMSQPELWFQLLQCHLHLIG